MKPATRLDHLRASPVTRWLWTPQAGRWALCLLTALLLIATVPRFTFQSLAPIALTPMLIACAKERCWRTRFLQGWAAGFAYWFFVCPWIQHVLEIHGGMGFLGGWATFLLFCVLKAIHLGVFAMLAGFAFRIPGAAVATAAIWTGVERTHGTFGFAWFPLGNAAIEWPWLLSIAQVVGVYGLSFLFAYTAAKLAQAVIDESWRPLAPFVILLGLPLRPAYVPTDRSAVLLQPMLTDSIEWSRLTLDELLTEFASHSNSAVRGVAGRDPANAPRLILWPEMPGPFYYFRDERFRAAASAVAQDNAASFVFTTVDRNAEGAPLNTALFVNARGEFVERYDKVNLVPFGEYIPPGFGWVNRITQEAGDFVPGKRHVNFPLPDAPLGVFICYESVFPDYIRQYARDGATVFANLSNDGYFGDSKAREQHLAIVRMRAVENKRWILRATNSGISAAIDPAGRVAQTLPPYERTARSLRYGLVRDVTLYSRYGDWFAWTCLVAGLAVAAIGMRRPATWNFEN